MSAVISDKLKTLAKDLTKDYPRSPRETLGGFVLATRSLDKCRATLNGTNGEYHYNCPLDQIFLNFAGIKADAFKDFIATGASDAEVAEWIQANATQKNRTEIVTWNNNLRYLTLKDLEPEKQVFFEDYIAENIPAGRVIYTWFDIYDIEEKRL
jgi:hypothetical protein